MKRIVSALMVLAAVAALMSVVTTSKYGFQSVHAQNGCTNAALSGNYLFHYSGFNSKRNNYATELPIAAVGVGTFDGTGNASFSYHDAFNGHIGATTTPDIGTYSVNSDCTFTLADPAAGQTWAGAIVGEGAEWDTIVTVTGYTATMSGKRQ